MQPVCRFRTGVNRSSFDSSHLLDEMRQNFPAVPDDPKTRRGENVGVLVRVYGDDGFGIAAARHVLPRP